MKLLQKITVPLVPALATLFVLAFPIGMVGFFCWFVCVQCCGFPVPYPIQAYVVFLAVKLIVWAYLLLPIGTLLHWMMAGTTKAYGRWVWSAIFLGSVLIMPADYPKGTISGAIVLVILYVVPTFRKMGEGVRVFRRQSGPGGLGKE